MNKEQLKALRTADSVSFNHKNGKGKIVATKKLPAKGGYPETDAICEIEVDSIVNSCRNGRLTDTANCHYFDWFSGRSGMHWRTALEFIKPTDELRLEWCKDYETNGNMEEHGLHGDRLVLFVTRKEKNFAFNIVSQCSKENMARLIR